MLKKIAFYFSIFCLVSFASISALYFFYSIKLPEKEPFKKDLVGNYSLDASGLEQNLSAIPYISLKEHSQCKMSVPKRWVNGANSDQLIFISGRWSVERDESSWSILVQQNFKERDELHHIVLVGHNPPYTLALPFGDPDEGNAFLFVKSTK